MTIINELRQTENDNEFMNKTKRGNLNEPVSIVEVDNSLLSEKFNMLLNYVPDHSWKWNSLSGWIILVTSSVVILSIISIISTGMFDIEYLAGNDLAAASSARLTAFLTLIGILISGSITILGAILAHFNNLKIADLKEREFLRLLVETQNNNIRGQEAAALNFETEARLKEETNTNNRLKSETEARLRLESAIKAIGMLDTLDGKAGAELQRIGVLNTLIGYGNYQLACVFTGELLRLSDSNKGISGRGASMILNRIIEMGDPEDRKNAVDIFAEQWPKFVIGRDRAVIPEFLDSRFNELDKTSRESAFMTLAVLITNKRFSIWHAGTRARITAILIRGWLEESDAQQKTYLGIILREILPAYKIYYGQHIDLGHSRGDLNTGEHLDELNAIDTDIKILGGIVEKCKAWAAKVPIDEGKPLFDPMKDN